MSNRVIRINSVRFIYSLKIHILLAVSFFISNVKIAKLIFNLSVIFRANLLVQNIMVENKYVYKKTNSAFKLLINNL